METQSFEFGEFRLDVKEKLLLRRGVSVPITPKAFQLLLALVENHGHLVEKTELMNRVWAESFVEEGNLAYTIRLLRKVLDDDKQNPRFIETVPKAGYRFIAEVKRLANAQVWPAESSKSPTVSPPQKRYFLVATGVVLLVCAFGIAFVWFSRNRSSSASQAKIGRLTTSRKVTNAAISRDGNHLVFAQKEGIGESLWRREMDSGNQARILPPQAVEFIGLAVSPDNNFVYYSVFSQNAAFIPLARIALRGGAPEPLPEIAADVAISFSPDGKKFAFTESHSSVKETRLKTADADGSNQKLLLAAKGDKRALPVFEASPVAWSPDGETIACAVRETDETGSYHRILLVSPDDGSEKYLSENRWHIVENIAWRDAENLAVIDYEPDSPVNRIWEISRTTGQARLVADDLNKYQWLSSANGHLLTVQKNVFSSLLVADFAENAVAPQAKQIFSEFGLIENVAWSLDGRIFYNSRASGKNEIWQINADGTAPRQLTVNSDLTYNFAVSPVDDTLVFPALKNGRLSLASADSNGRSIRPLTDGAQDLAPAFAPDGKTVVFQRGAASPTLWRVPVEGNAQPTQLTGYLATHPAVSPDGREIIFHFIDYGGKNPHWKLGLINSDSRRLLSKLEFPVPIFQRKTVWRPNDYLLTMVFSGGEGSGLLLLSPADGKFQTIDNLAAGKITDFDWSADGRRLAFSQNYETNDVVLLSGF